MKRLLGLVSLVVLVGAAMAGSTSAASGRTVRAAGSEQFVPNVKIMATLRFTPGPLRSNRVRRSRGRTRRLRAAHNQRRRCGRRAEHDR